MKTALLRLPFVLFLSAWFFATVLRAADASASSVAPAASAGKLYVAIDTFDPIRFNDLRQARREAGELVLSTLKETAAASARFAGFTDEVIVLDEGAKAPAGARVLRLTWTQGSDVTADLTEHGKNYYLGVVSRKDVLMHPDHQRMLRAMTMNAHPDAAYDAQVRTKTEMNLYFALKQVAVRDARAAAAKKSGG